MANIVIIPCAGSGSRLGATIPKQYINICGTKTILDYTLESFLAVPLIDKIMVVVSHNDNMIDDILAKYNDNRLIMHKIGGETRAETVLNGLKKLSGDINDDDWVLVHDAARCLITSELIIKLINELQNDSVGGILAIPVYDTVKKVVDKKIQATMPREQIYLAQTPQMFRYSILYRALSNYDLTLLTDEASAVEKTGVNVKIVIGDSSNIKITHIGDLNLAKFLLKNNKIDKSIKLK